MVALLSSAAFAQDDNDFRLEVTAGGWRASPTGTLQSGIVPVDLESDLALQTRWTFTGKLTLKPGRKHRIFIEGSPYVFEGRNTLSRTIEYRGVTFTLTDTIESDADLTYFAAGYQYDLLSGSRGHLGAQISGALLDATGTIRSTSTGLTATRSERIGLPLAGLEGRLWLIPGSRLLNVNGEFKGMSLGDYGRFMQGGIHVGVGIRRVTLQAGYAVLDADVHEAGGDRVGIAPRFSGSVFSIQFRDR